MFSFAILSTLSAQEYGIYEIEKNSKGKDKDKNGKSGNRTNFYNLALNLQPTHYIENNSIKKTYNAGDPIKVTIEDSKSYNYMKNNKSKYPNVEIIIISLEQPSDINKSIDLSN